MLLLGPVTLACGAQSRWVDSVSLSLGKDNDSNKTYAFQFGIQNNWNRTWFNEGAWFVGGYWDASLAYMKSDFNQNSRLYDLSITPFLRLQRDAALSKGVSPFSEIGIGGHLLTDTKIGERDLTTRLQFGPEVGLGLGFGDKGSYKLTYRYQYLTNGGIKDPNDGLKMHFLSFGYAFR
jgi:lipid A 3-O-deacylase